MCVWGRVRHPAVECVLGGGAGVEKVAVCLMLVGGTAIAPSAAGQAARVRTGLTSLWPLKPWFVLRPT
jgi:hypothetical protein